MSTPGTDPQTSAGAVPAPPVAADSQPTVEERPVDEAELRQKIERTREELGETVEQLAAKTDVQGRARAKAAELAGRAKSTTAQARTQAAAQFGNVRVPLAVAAVTLIAGYLVFRWWRKR